MVCVCMRVYACVCVRMRVYVWVCVRMRAYACVCVGMHVCVCLFVCLCVCIFTSILLYLFVRICIFADVYVHMHMCASCVSTRTDRHSFHIYSFHLLVMEDQSLMEECLELPTNILWGFFISIKYSGFDDILLLFIYLFIYCFLWL